MPQLRNVRQRALVQSATGMKHNVGVRHTPNELLTPSVWLCEEAPLADAQHVSEAEEELAACEREKEEDGIRLEALLLSRRGGILLLKGRRG
eukprot:5695561-Pleurochrysis_carterae.AAC.1